tara:strand:+ start:449 stop:631 length:183 start_codon:yes stop_codon:yes gene_type:complete
MVRKYENTHYGGINGICSTSYISLMHVRINYLNKCKNNKNFDREKAKNDISKYFIERTKI